MSLDPNPPHMGSNPKAEFIDFVLKGGDRTTRAEVNLDTGKEMLGNPLDTLTRAQAR